jgi:leader peptidase (prepilin peptidase)/N-methyltransferase
MLSTRSARFLPIRGKRSATLLGLLVVAIAAASFAAFSVPTALVSCVLGLTALAIAISDARRFIVPDRLSLPLIPAGLAATGLLADREVASVLVLEHIAAAGIAAGALYAIRYLYSRWRGRDGLGLGDVKLAAAAGAWTGIAGFAYVLLLACCLAISFVYLAQGGNRRRVSAFTAVPLGAFLAPSIWLVWCVSELGADGQLPLYLPPL